MLGSVCLCGSNLNTHIKPEKLNASREKNCLLNPSHEGKTKLYFKIQNGVCLPIYMMMQKKRRWSNNSNSPPNQENCNKQCL